MSPTTGESSAAFGDTGKNGAPVVAPVPVVDLTATVAGLHAHADGLRRNARHLIDLVDALRREADYLEDLAAVLSGGQGRG